MWKTKVGPGGTTGGSEWGSATDGDQVYVAISNSLVKKWELVKDGKKTGKFIHRGLWSALDAKDGKIIWQTPELYQAPPNSKLGGLGPQGAVTVANGVLFAGSETPNPDPSEKTFDMLALDAKDGRVLWKFSSGGVINSGAAVVDGVVYWGNINSDGNSTLYAFCVAGQPGCP